MTTGERPRTVTDATWVSVIPSAEVCTRLGRDHKECRPFAAMVLGHTGPTPPEGRGWVIVPKSKSAAIDNSGSLRPGGCNFAVCDGSVRFLKATDDVVVFSSL